MGPACPSAAPWGTHCLQDLLHPTEKQDVPGKGGGKLHVSLHSRVSVLGTNAGCSQSPLQSRTKLCPSPVLKLFLAPQLFLLRAVFLPTHSMERGLDTSCEGNTLCHCCSPSFSSLASHRC